MNAQSINTNMTKHQSTCLWPSLSMLSFVVLFDHPCAGVIEESIVMCLTLFLWNNILSYINKCCSSIHPVRFPSNIQPKHCTKPILNHYIHYSSWRFMYHVTNEKIGFPNRICTKSCCNMIFHQKIHWKYQCCKQWSNVSIQEPFRILLIPY